MQGASLIGSSIAFGRKSDWKLAEPKGKFKIEVHGIKQRKKNGNNYPEKLEPIKSSSLSTLDSESSSPQPETMYVKIQPEVLPSIRSKTSSRVSSSCNVTQISNVENYISEDISDGSKVNNDDEALKKEEYDESKTDKLHSEIEAFLSKATEKGIQNDQLVQKENIDFIDGGAESSDMESSFGSDSDCYKENHKSMIDSAVGYSPPVSEDIPDDKINEASDHLKICCMNENLEPLDNLDTNDLNRQLEYNTTKEIEKPNEYLEVKSENSESFLQPDIDNEFQQILANNSLQLSTSLPNLNQSPVFSTEECNIMKKSPSHCCITKGTVSDIEIKPLMVCSMPNIEEQVENGSNQRNGENHGIKELSVQPFKYFNDVAPAAEMNDYDDFQMEAWDVSGEYSTISYIPAREYNSSDTDITDDDEDLRNNNNRWNKFDNINGIEKKNIIKTSRIPLHTVGRKKQYLNIINFVGIL